MDEVIQVRHNKRVPLLSEFCHLDLIQEMKKILGGLHFRCRRNNCFIGHKIQLAKKVGDIPEFVFFVYELKEFGI